MTYHVTVVWTNDNNHQQTLDKLCAKGYRLKNVSSAEKTARLIMERSAKYEYIVTNSLTAIHDGMELMHAVPSSSGPVKYVFRKEIEEPPQEESDSTTDATGFPTESQPQPEPLTPINDLRWEIVNALLKAQEDGVFTGLEVTSAIKEVGNLDREQLVELIDKSKVKANA